MSLLAEQTNPLISVAIVTWNRSAEVLRAIQSVYDQNFQNFEVVIADNHSTDDTVALIEQQFPESKVVRLHRNLGASEGRNIALSNCRGEIIFNLDDDAVVKPNTLTLIMDFFAATPAIGLVACQVYENGTCKYPDQSGETAIFEGCGWAIRRVVLEEVGYFSDRLFRAAEETDFAFNYLMAGYKMWFLCESVIHHMPSKIRIEEEVSFYKSRNELIIIFERYPIALILPFAVWTAISQIKYGLHNPSHLLYIIRGLLSGLKNLPDCLKRHKSVSVSVLRKVRFSPMHGSKLAFLLQENLIAR